MSFKIVLEQNQNIWFSSDFHYHHKNICSGTSKWGDESRTRPFETLEDMDNTIVEHINEKVKQDDWLIGLGDFAFGGIEYIPEFRRRINCKNIVWIIGNHDHNIENNRDNVMSLFYKVYHYCELEVIRNEHKQKFVLCHYPIASWNGLRKGVIHLHGHVHFPENLRVGPGKMMDVGIDGHPEFRPYSYDEVMSFMNKNPLVSFFVMDSERYKFE